MNRKGLSCRVSGLVIYVATTFSNETDSVYGPLNFFREHAVHWRHDLHGHVDEAFGEDERDVV